MRLLDFAGAVRVRASSYVDASGHAGLCLACGLADAAGLGRALQPASLPMRLGGVARDAMPDWDRLAVLIAEHNRTAARPITRPGGGVLLRLPLSGDAWWTVVDIALDGVSGEALARAETEARERAWEALAVLRMLPGFEHATITTTGPQLGLRESGRPPARHAVTQADALAGRRDPAGIARAAWPMEVHEGPGRVRWVPLGGEGFFDIPLDALRAAGPNNLWLAGRLIGADGMAYASVRVMGTAFATGHAAGVAAALQARTGCAPSTAAVREELLRQGALA